MTELIEFHGMEIEATCESGMPFANLKRMCEDLGIDYASQSVKLAESHWATVVNIPTVAADGKLRDMTFVSADTIPTWLAGINERKVAEAVRPQLRVLQQEIRDVLYRHFTKQDDLSVYGKIGDMVASGMQRGFDRYFGPLNTKVDRCETKIDQLGSRVEKIEGHLSLQKKPFSKATHKAAVCCVEELYAGRCPCCDTVTATLEGHHWRGKGGNSPQIYMPLRPECHAEAERGGQEWHDKKEPRFAVFQERCRIYFIRVGCLNDSKRWEIQKTLFNE